MFNQRIKNSCNEKHQKGLLRHTHEFSLAGNRIKDQKSTQNYINFSSNDYLGLRQSKQLKKFHHQGIEKYGFASCGSPLVTGRHDAHADLENTLCDWLGYPSAILYSSGFAANQALILTLMQNKDLLLQDRLNHASLQEAGSLCSAKMQRFKHNDYTHLSALLDKESTQKAEGRLVVSEGVFSMDGDSAELPQLSQICKAKNAWLMLDDAHACGVLGNDGGGSCSMHNIHPDILVVTFGKAFAGNGAAILCSQELAQYLIQFSKHYIYSTAISPAQAYALNKTCTLIQNAHQEREKLRRLSECLSEHLDASIPLVSTQTPIKPILVGESEQTVKISQLIAQEGFWLSAIRPPTVPINSARLRLTLNASHTEEQVQALALAINKAFDKVKGG